MNRRSIALSGLAVAVLWLPALAAEAPRGQAREQASIPFANLGGIENWRAADNDTLYVEGRNDRWYRAELFGPCIGLDTAIRIGFVVEPAASSFDRFSSVLVEGHECRLRSLVEVDQPPPRRRGSTPAMARNEGAAARNEGTASGAGRNTNAAAKAGAAGAARQDVQISFANLGGIQDWRAQDDDTLFVQGRNDQWYRAELLGSCPGLPFETTIGFVLEPSGAFDRFSSIVVDGRECPLRSFVESDAPSGSRRASAPASSAKPGEERR